MSTATSPKYRATEQAETFQVAVPNVVDLSGRTLNEVVLEAQARSARTEYVDIKQVRFEDDGSLDTGMFFSDEGLTRLCTVLKLPRRTINLLLKAGGRREAADAIRCMMRSSFSTGAELALIDGVIEGVTSPEYTRLSNADAATLVDDSLHHTDRDLPNIRVARARFNGTQMLLSIVSEMARDLNVPGDPVDAGLEVVNGEDGSRTTDVEGFLYRLICSNGARAKGASTGGSIIHRGSDPMSRLLPVVNEALDASVHLMGRLVPAVNVRLDDRQTQGHLHGKTVERFGNAFAAAVSEAASVEQNQFRRPFLTAYDYWNGITQQARSVASMSRARQIEEFGSTVLDWAHKRFTRAQVDARPN